MTTRSRDDDRLGAALTRLGSELAWPAEPDLASRIGGTIREQRRSPSLVTPRLSLPSRRRSVIAIAAALLALAGVAIGARLVIQLGAVAVQVLPGRPTALPTAVATGDDFGREVAIADAEAAAGFPAALPTALGPPDRAWVDEANVGVEPDDIAVRIATGWAPSSELREIPRTDLGALMFQFEGEWDVASKQLSAETNRFAEAFVEGREAFWTSGRHELVLVSGDESRRLLVTGNVLIWQDAGYTFRLETSLTKSAAIAIAESVDPVVDLG